MKVKSVARQEKEVIAMRKKFSYFEAPGQMMSDAYRAISALFHVGVDYSSRRASR